MSKQLLLSLLAVGIAAVLPAVAYYYRPTTNYVPLAGLGGPPLVDQSSLAKLPARQASSADLSHLGKGILPPTNSWLSGMVLQRTPQAVYPMPLSFLAKQTGFEVGLPTISSTAATILGEHVPGVQATIDQAVSFKLSRYDKVSATIAYYDEGNKQLSTLTLAEGSPFVFYQASVDSKLVLSGANPNASDNSNKQSVRYSRNGHDYVVKLQKGATISQQDNNLTVHATKGSTVSFYALPNAVARDTLQAYADNVVQSVTVTPSQTPQTAITSFVYKTANGKPTLMAALPYQNIISHNPVIVSYDSIYGLLKAVKGNSYAIAAPAIIPSNQLDLSHFSSDQRTRLATELAADVARTTIDKTDSYFAGKQLARAANLLDIAEQLQEKDSIAKLTNLLAEAFNRRLGSNYFYYDSWLKGIAANTKAFGSEDFNDHHFHYGYFLYAASILGKYDKPFVASYKPQLNLLAADIASYKPGNNFPLTRNYDPYTSHAWAAGLAPFADGNNQESSSEAINAWNGVSLWGRLTQNKSLQQTGQWMLAFESATAQSSWRTVNTAATGLGGYTSPLVDINFGGKRVYSTFFSDLTSAKLGIQLIPLNPAMVSFAGDKTNINRLVRASISNDNYNVPLGDYILMYLALSSPQHAEALSLNQQQMFIDDGNSRTYMDAWIFTQQISQTKY